MIKWTRDIQSWIQVTERYIVLIQHNFKGDTHARQLQANERGQNRTNIPSLGFEPKTSDDKQTLYHLSYHLVNNWVSHIVLLQLSDYIMLMGTNSLVCYDYIKLIM